MGQKHNSWGLFSTKTPLFLNILAILGVIPSNFKVMDILDKPLVNRVAESGLITLNLEDSFPTAPTAVFDLKNYLFMELILKEKDFREALKNHDWQQYEGKTLLVVCSADAIIPTWAYMLVTVYAAPVVQAIFQGTEEEYIKAHYFEVLKKMDLTPYEGKMLVIKGCSDRPVPPEAYMEITRRLQPLAKSIMFGEPCSTVPIYKKPK